MDEDGVLEPNQLIRDDEARPVIDGRGSDEPVTEELDSGSLASGIESRRLLEKKLKRDLPIMGVSFLPFVAIEHPC